MQLAALVVRLTPGAKRRRARKLARPSRKVRIQRWLLLRATEAVAPPPRERLSFRDLRDRIFQRGRRRAEPLIAEQVKLAAHVQGQRRQTRIGGKSRAFARGLGLQCFLLLAVAAPAFAQGGGMLLNPGGAMSIESSPDHANAASYTVGWFKQPTDTAPVVAETIPAANVTGTGPYLLTTKTRPPYARYTLKVKLTVKDPCDPGFCESQWSDPAVYEKDLTISAFGYTPANPRGFLIR